MKSVIFILFFLSFSVSAGEDCQPRVGGGFNCYDYDTRSSSTVIPTVEGGYRVDEGLKPLNGFRKEKEKEVKRWDTWKDPERYYDYGRK